MGPGGWILAGLVLIPWWFVCSWAFRIIGVLVVAKVIERGVRGAKGRKGAGIPLQGKAG